MRAVQCRETTGIDGLRLVEVPRPEPGACHVQIRVEAAGINHADLLTITGRYQEKPHLPFVPGFEIAGRIEALGAGVTDLKVGQRVLALLDHGGFAEHAIALPEDTIALPDGMDFATAAAMAVTHGTAHGALVWRAVLHAGETLLVHGGTGGAGQAAIECGKALGATVIATARDEAGLELARRHGADHAVATGGGDLRRRLLDLTGGRGVDVVFDAVGGELFEASLGAIAWEGRIVVVGFASGVVPQVPANILLVKNVAVLGFNWGSYRRHDPARLRSSFHDLFAWHAAGRVRPVIGGRYGLAAVPEALRALEQRTVRGKLVVEPGRDGDDKSRD